MDKTVAVMGDLFFSISQQRHELVGGHHVDGAERSENPQILVYSDEVLDTSDQGTGYALVPPCSRSQYVIY